MPRTPFGVRGVLHACAAWGYDFGLPQLFPVFCPVRSFSRFARVSFFGKGQSALAATARPVVACKKLSPRHRAGLAASGRLPERAPCAETMAVGLRAGEKGKSVRFEPYAKSRPLQGPRRP